MFHKIFFSKKRKFFLRRPDSTKNVPLNGKIIIGHCKGHDKIILIILFDELNEKTKGIYHDC